MTTDIEIARAATLKPIADIAARLNIPADALEPYGRHKAKVGFDFINSVQDRKDGALVLVTGISPTPAGEGKTTTTVGRLPQARFSMSASTPGARILSSTTAPPRVPWVVT